MERWSPRAQREYKVTYKVLLQTPSGNVTALVELPKPDYLARFSKEGWNLFFALYPGQIDGAVIQAKTNFSCEAFASRAQQATDQGVADMMKVLPPIVFLQWFCNTRPVQTLLGVRKVKALQQGRQRLESVA